jgi:hypothetical protein
MKIIIIEEKNVEKCSQSINKPLRLEQLWRGVCSANGAFAQA